jgi:hypothetical protein
MKHGTTIIASIEMIPWLLVFWYMIKIGNLLESEKCNDVDVEFLWQKNFFGWSPRMLNGEFRDAGVDATSLKIPVDGSLSRKQSIDVSSGVSVDGRLVASSNQSQSLCRSHVLDE